MRMQLARRGKKRRTGGADDQAPKRITAPTAQVIDARDLGESAGLRPAVARQLLAMQAGQGNRHVQGLIGGLVQRDAAAEAASATAPGLSATVVREIEANIGTDRPAALAAIVRALAAGGKIDLSFLENGTMTFISDTSRMRPGHSGHTSLTAGSQRPRPCRVEMGPDAFQGVSTLYATVMHEWQHVLQFRRPTMGGEAVDELEARLWEIENLENTGLWRNATYMGQIRGQLDHWWRELTPEEQTPHREDYEKAVEKIAAMRERLLDEQFRQQQGRK